MKTILSTNPLLDSTKKKVFGADDTTVFGDPKEKQRQRHVQKSPADARVMRNSSTCIKAPIVEI